MKIAFLKQKIDIKEKKNLFFTENIIRKYSWMMKDIHLFNDTQLKMKNSLIYLEKLTKILILKLLYSFLLSLSKSLHILLANESLYMKVFIQHKLS